jgi:uncharacterized iron-regulated protein
VITRRLGLGLGLALAVVALLAACAGTQAGAPDRALREARFVLLGEVHDNAEQHRQRAALLRQLLADGRATRVVFEQIDRGHDEAIAAAPRQVEAVIDAARFDRCAWGWPLHQPLFEAALDGGARIAGGNLSREAARAVMRDGLPAVPAELRPLLGQPAWSAEQQAAMEALIDHGHCRMLPADRWPAMVLAQRARDAAMAQAMLQAPPAERVVLIAGNGHVRSDLGVPWLLREAGVPARDIVAVVYLEDDDPAPPADRVVRTVRVERADPCEGLRGRPG